MFKETNPEFKCSCPTCRSSRKKLSDLKNDDSALSYHMQVILKEMLGEGNY